MVSGGEMTPFTAMMIYFLTTGVEHMEQRIKALREKMEQQIGQVDSKDKLAAFWQDFLGKKGSVADLMKGLGAVAKEDRPAMGKVINSSSGQTGPLPWGPIAFFTTNLAWRRSSLSGIFPASILFPISLPADTRLTPCGK